MRKNVFLGLIAATLVVFGSFSASALNMIATVNTIYTDSTLGGVVPFATGDGGVSGTAALAPGNVVALDITVSNPLGETITGMFATLTVQGDDIGSILGTLLPPTMLKLPPFGGSLADVGTGNVKGNSPGALGAPGDVWIQGLAYALQAGAKGLGPDTVQIYLVLGAGVTANQYISFDMGVTAGDAFGGPSSTTFGSASINVIPEPGTALLMGLGLAGLAAAGRRQS